MYEPMIAGYHAYPKHFEVVTVVNHIHTKLGSIVLPKTRKTSDRKPVSKTTKSPGRTHGSRTRANRQCPSAVTPSSDISKDRVRG